MNILVSGVGGQGVILFSNIISEIALSAGLDVKKSEVHGMAQRGGSVTTHIRYAPKVYSPLIGEGTADVIVAFEMMEALRYIHFLGPNGRLIYDTHRIDPLPISTGVVERPTDEKLGQLLAEHVRHDASGVMRSAVCVPAFETALKLGNARVQNVVMLGAISRFLEFPEEAHHQAISRLVKPKVVELNLKAFAEGRALCGQ